MKFIIGVDEAGRGPLAGPVAVGLVLVEEGFDVACEFPGVDDSKKLSEKKREAIFEMLEKRAEQGEVRFEVEFGSAADIDRDGIAAVIRELVARGVGSLTSNTNNRDLTSIVLDGGLRAPEAYAQETIIHGDALVPLISLASVAAKVSRDRLMRAAAGDYPAYGFEKHKGYGTRAHYKALHAHGLCAIHRRSFTHLAP